MGSDLGVCANIVRVILVIINILFAALGIVLIAVGSWLIATNQAFVFITGNQVIGGAALLIIAGIVTLIICATGILGAIFKLRPILIVYAGVVLIIVILEIVAGILGFVFQNNVVDTVSSRSLNAISLYIGSPDQGNTTQRDATTAVDIIQNTLECCGYNNASDWITTNPTFLRENNRVPPGYGDPLSGCYECNPANEGCMTFSGPIPADPPSAPPIQVTFNVTDTGCIGRLQGSVVILASATGAIGIVFGLLEIAGIVFALALCCCITSARKQEVV